MPRGRQTGARLPPPVPATGGYRATLCTLLLPPVGGTGLAQNGPTDAYGVDLGRPSRTRVGQSATGLLIGPQRIGTLCPTSGHPSEQTGPAQLDRAHLTSDATAWNAEPEYRAPAHAPHFALCAICSRAGHSVTWG